MALVKIDSLSDSNFHTWKQKIILIIPFLILINISKEMLQGLMMTPGKHGSKVLGKLEWFWPSLSDEHLKHLSDASTTKEIWNDKLNVFERCTLLNKLAAQQRFYTVKLQAGEKILPYLNSVKQLSGTPKFTTSNVDDNDSALAALNGLLSSSEHLIVTLNALGNYENLFIFDLFEEPASPRGATILNA